MKRIVLVGVTLAVSCGCTVVQVKPVERAANNVAMVCIEENEAVNKAGFLPLLEGKFTEHGIGTQRYKGKPPEACEYTASYVAHWNWDLAVYLTDAEVVIRRGGEVVGKAVYHLRNKGGLALSKFASAESKMSPVLDKLLTEFSKQQI